VDGGTGVGERTATGVAGGDGVGEGGVATHAARTSASRAIDPRNSFIVGQDSRSGRIGQGEVRVILNMYVRVRV
jgi:hypothetical protein